MREKCWISCRSFTIQANCNERGIVVFVAPIAKKFKGHHLSNLLQWAESFGDYQSVCLKSVPVERIPKQRDIRDTCSPYSVYLE